MGSDPVIHLNGNMKHYITYFSLIALHFSLTSCHTQRAVQAETCHETDTLESHAVEVQTLLVDSLVKEMTISADTVCMVSLPDQSTHLVAKGVKVTARKSKVKEEKAKVCIEDTTSVHIRDTTSLRKDKEAVLITEPPDSNTLLPFLVLSCTAIAIAYLALKMRR